MNIDLDNVENFADFAENTRLQGDKVKIENILNKEIIIVRYRVKPSKIKSDTQCLTLQFVYPEEVHKVYVLFTGSEVLRSQVVDYQSRLPFKTVIQKISNYYSFT